MLFLAVDVLLPFAVRLGLCGSVSVPSSCDASNQRCPLFHCAPNLQLKRTPASLTLRFAQRHF
jgi:hypothetical protein